MRLEIFAFHVATICTDEVGSIFTLTPGDNVQARIEIQSEHEVYVNGINVGNRHGAVKEFTRLVKESNPEWID